MRLTDRMVDEQRRNRMREEKQTDNQQDENQEDEMGYAYRPRPRWGFLNDSGSVFDSKDETSINTAPSVFEKGTLFRVKRDETDGL